MIIEQNPNYAYKLKYMDNPTFDKVRDLSTKFYRELPQALQDELFEALNRGIDILDSEPQMTAYLFAYGKMHKAKLNYAFEHLPETFFEIPEINIIDYGCGQAVATMCYADFLRKQGYKQKIRRVTMIEPSEAALKRAALHVSVFFPDAETVTINKGFDDLETKDIVCDEDVPTLHLLSNVLDLECFSLIAFKKLVKKGIGPSNLFVCVGPYFGDKDRGKHMDSFANYFKGEEIYSEDLDAYELDEDNSWTCMVRCFGVGDLDYSISDKNLSTEVTVEDIENGIKDKFGVVYSKDGKRLLCTNGFDCETYTIRKGVKIICDEAFSGCRALRSIVIPNSVTSIGNIAFSCCKSLQSIVIPNSVTSIGDWAFVGCKSLKTIVIPESVTSIGVFAFENCKSLQSIGIPNSVTSIGDGAFGGCDSLQSIVIPNSVTSIGYSAFGGCDSLQSIVIPDSVTSIGDSAFDCCDSLQSIGIPNSVTSIGDGAFHCCDSLQSIVIPDSVTSIGDRAFAGCKSLQSIVIPNSVTSIGNSAFDCCDSLQSIVIPDTVTSIGVSALSFCSSLQSIFIPNSVTSIGDRAFEGCKSLQSIFIPNSVTSIGDLAFEGCKSLQSIIIPKGLKDIGSRAFFGCKSLRSIVIPNSVTSIGVQPFSGSGICSIVCHSKSFKVDGKALYDRNMKHMIAFYSDDIHFVIPASVTSIGYGAFSCCDSLQSIVIPNSVTSIGENAFLGCKSLQSIVISNSVKSIGGGAFLYCHSLQSIVIPNSVKSIGEQTFNGCDSLRAIIIPKGSRAKFEKMLDEELWDKLVEK